MAKVKLIPEAEQITLFSSAVDSFTKSEIKLCNFIALNYRDFVHMTISELSAAANISEISIWRFCKKLNLNGVQALKLKLVYFMQHQTSSGNNDLSKLETALLSDEGQALIQDQTADSKQNVLPHQKTAATNLSQTSKSADTTSTTPSNLGLKHNPLDTNNDLASSCLPPKVSAQAARMSAALNSSSKHLAKTNSVAVHDSMETISTDVFSDIITGLQQTLGLIDFNEMEKAAHIINECERLMIFGFGNSSIVNHDIATRFVRFGISCEASSDLHQQITLASVANAKTTIIATSFTGYSLKFDEVLKTAQDRGAKVILITSKKQSPMAKIADAVLVGVCPQIYSHTEASLSRIIYLSIADALYVKLTLLKGDNYNTNMDNIKESLNKLKPRKN